MNLPYTLASTKPRTSSSSKAKSQADRRLCPPVVSGRHAHALPMFQQVLLFIHSMRLVLAPIDRIEWALSGLYNRALPSPNEAVVLKQPLPKGK